MKTQVYVLAIAGLVILNTGCTRKADDSNAKTTQVSFALPSVKSGSNKISQSVSGQSSTLSHAIINITGSKGAIYCNWDKHGSSSGPCAFSLPYVTLDVPSGSSFIQVLLAFDDQSNNQTTFSYGDVTTTLSGSAMSVGITVTSLGGGSSSFADIEGRYYTNSSTSPSGILSTKIVPVAGKPAMVLDQQYVANGWFKTFSMSGLDMAYGLTDLSTGIETQWFGGNINLNYFIGNVTTTPDDTGYSKSASYVSYASARYISGGSGHYDVMGFFGSPPAAASNYAVTDNSCSGAEYNTCLNISSSVKTRFRGVFQKSASGYLQWVSNVLSWTLLNGINSSNLDSVSIYKVTGLSASTINSLRKMNDTFDCNQVATNANATLISNVTPVSTTSLNVASYPISDPTTEAYFACPIRLGQKLDGVAYPETWNNMTGSGGTTGPYLRMEINSYNNGSGAPLTVGKCYSAMLRAYISNGSGSAAAYDVGTTQTITTTVTGGSATFYSAGSCTGATSTFSMSSNVSGSYTYIWFKVTAPAASMNFSATSSPSSEITLSTDGAYTAANPFLKFTLPTALLNNKCYPLRLSLLEADGATPYTDFSGSVSYSTTTSGALYGSDSTCTSGSASSDSGTFTISNLSGLRYFKSPVSGAFSGTLTSADANFTVIDTNYSKMSAGGDVMPTKIGVSTSGSIYAGKCTPLKISTQNTVNADVIAPTTYNIKLSAPRGSLSFYSNSACAATISTANITQDDSSTTVFVMGHVPSGSISITADAGAGMIGTLSIPISTPTTGMYIHPTSLPNFSNATYVGTQEFTDNSGTALLIPLNYTSGASVYCTRQSDQSSCNSLLSGNSFVWTASEMIANPGEGYSLRVNSGGLNATYYFSPQNIWGLYFTVFNCSSTLSSGTALSSGNITGGSQVCLGSGTFTLSSSANITGASVIGRANKSSVVTVTGDGEFFASGGATNMYLANMTINDDATTATGARGTIRTSTLSVAMIIDNLDINFKPNTSWGVAAINVSNPSSSSSTIKNVNITTTGAGGGSSTYGIYVTNGSFYEISNVNITNSLSNYFTGMRFYASSSSCNVNSINDYVYSGVYLGFSANGTSGSYNVTFAANRWKFTSQGSNKMVDLQGYYTGNFYDSSFASQANYHTIDTQGYGSITLTRNLFLMPSDYYAVIISSSGGISEMVHNQFVKTGTSSTGYYAIYYTSAGSYGSSLANTNLLCAPSGTYGWGGLMTGSGSGTGVSNNSGTTGRYGASYVDATNRCISSN